MLIPHQLLCIIYEAKDIEINPFFKCSLNNKNSFEVRIILLYRVIRLLLSNPDFLHVYKGAESARDACHPEISGLACISSNPE